MVSTVWQVVPWVRHSHESIREQVLGCFIYGTSLLPSLSTLLRGHLHPPHSSHVHWGQVPSKETLPPSMHLCSFLYKI